MVEMERFAAKAVLNEGAVEDLLVPIGAHPSRPWFLSQPQIKFDRALNHAEFPACAHLLVQLSSILDRFYYGNDRFCDWRQGLDEDTLASKLWFAGP